jgi:hypothetical protein
MVKPAVLRRPVEAAEQYRNLPAPRPNPVTLEAFGRLEGLTTDATAVPPSPGPTLGFASATSTLS